MWSHRVAERFHEQRLGDILIQCNSHQSQPQPQPQQQQQGLQPSPQLAGYRALIVLRHPIERFFSVLHFFGPARLSPEHDGLRKRLRHDPASTGPEDGVTLFTALSEVRHLNI